MNKNLKTGALFFLLACLVIFNLSAQGNEKVKKLTIALQDNSTNLPGTGYLGLLNLPIHPGLVAGIEIPYIQHPQSAWFQTAKAGIFYHHLAQSAIQLYTEIGYRHQVVNNFSVDAKLGGGYLHSIPDVDIFKQDESGNYIKTGRLGRPQAMAGLNIGFNYEAFQFHNKPVTLFFNYHFWFQFPFVKSYVPVLPNTALEIGFSMPLGKNNTK